MFQFPKAKLGEVTAFTITTTDLEKSLNYYQRLGFSELFRTDFPFPLIQISDGGIMIMLREGTKPYIALTYYVKEIDSVVSELESTGVVVQRIPTPSPMVKRFLFQTEEGFNLTLVSYVEGFVQPAGKTLLTMPPSDYSKPEKYTNQTCGLFGEYALPVKNMGQSIVFWEKLGFKTLSQRTTPFPWAILSDGLSIIGLHETTQFDTPIITYFAPDMKEKIEKLKANGLTDYIEKGGNNFVLTTPEGQKVNLFKLGM